MNRFIKKISLLMLIALVMMTTIVTAFAYDKVTYMTEDEIFNEVWEMYAERNYHGEKDFTTALKLAISKGELKKYVHNYKPINEDVDVNDVKNEFGKYLSNTLGDTEITEDNDGKVYEYNKDNPTDRYYWTYNTSNKKFVCQDNNGKIIKSYDGAFYEKKRTKQATATTTTEVTSEPVTESSVTSNTVVSKSKTVTINSTPDEIKKDNSSNIFKIVIAIVYLCVFAIVIAIIVRLIHKKKGKKE